jgi:hypothetical protein
MKQFPAAVLLLACLGLNVPAAEKASTPTNTFPAYRALVENERVRVLELTLTPSARTAVTPHPAHLVWSSSDAEVRLTAPNGQFRDRKWPREQPQWSDATIRSVANLGSNEVHFLTFELKEPARRSRRSTPSRSDPLRVAPASFKVLLENRRVRVLEASDPPGATVPSHEHPDSIVLALTPARQRMIAADGTSREVEVQPGQVTLLPAGAHSTVNLGPERARALIVELKEPKPSVVP